MNGVALFRLAGFLGRHGEGRLATALAAVGALTVTSRALAVARLCPQLARLVLPLTNDRGARVRAIEATNRKCARPRHPAAAMP